MRLDSFIAFKKIFINNIIDCWDKIVSGIRLLPRSIETPFASLFPSSSMGGCDFENRMKRVKNIHNTVNTTIV